MTKIIIKKMSVIMLVVISILLLALSLCACSTAAIEQAYPMPEQMSFTATALQSALDSGKTLDVKIEAEVYPYNAINKQVDFSVSWGNGATRSAEVVTDYVTVTPDSDGSTKATVSCKKAFGSDKIIITVTTRDGGYTANCTVSFVGKATGMEITSTQAAKKSTSQRGEYFELGSNKTYAFNVNLANAINSVGTSDLSVAVNAYGQVYFGTTYTDDAGYARFYDMVKKDISQFKDKLISASVSGTTLTIIAPSVYREDFSDRVGYDDFGAQCYRYDKFVCEDPWDLGFISGMYTKDDYPGKAKENQQLLKSCYFTVTVSDHISGLSQTIRVWIEQSVTGVSLSNKTLSI